MKVIIDNKIPYIKEAIGKIASEVIYAAGKDFTPELVKDADALIIRTRTRCNRELLEGSRVKFIATATIGFDHIDTEYCREAGISWSNAPGCNADSVAQYLQSTLILLKWLKHKPLQEMTIGIVGVGHVGSKVAQVARNLGMRVLLCDPPRQEAEQSDEFCSPADIARESHIITFHVPLIKEGRHRTFHMAGDTFFHSLRRQPVIINTSRGEVIETAPLIRAMENEMVEDAVIDVWEDEPTINRTLLYKVFIGTPHIAGYSADGKANATRMSLDALCRHFGIKARYTIEAPIPTETVIEAPDMDDACLLMYDPRRDSNALKQQPELFEQLRENYPLRREAKAYTVQLRNSSDAND